MKELIEGLLGEGQIEKAISIFSKWEIIDHHTRNEIVVQSSRLNEAKRSFLQGMSTQESYSVERTKITYYLLELVSEIERRYIGTPQKYIPKAILVAGTGTNAITEQEILISKVLGQYLAEKEYILIAGGWNGVDYYTTTHFCENITKKQNVSLFKHLFQIIPKHKEPMYNAGNVFYVNEGTEEWTKCLNLADYVILIGGLGGTYSTFKLSIRERVPVFPFFDTQRDTTLVFNDLKETWPADIYKGIDRDEFLRTLSAPIQNENDVRRTLDKLEHYMAVIENVTNSRSI